MKTTHAGTDRRLWPPVAALSVFVSILLTASPGQADCPLAQARYKLANDADITAGFISKRHVPNYDPEFLLFIHSNKSKQIYWFFFEESIAEYINIYSTTNGLSDSWTLPGEGKQSAKDSPLAGMTIMFADKGYRFRYRMPNHLKRRPEYLLIPDLPAELAKNGVPPERIPLAFFQFDHCASAGAFSF